MLHVAFRK